MNDQTPRHGRNEPSSMFFWPTADRPTAVRGEGIFIFDEEGRRYVDASCGPQTTNIGHNNRHVVEAMRAQMDDICFAFRSHFKNGPAERLADRLAVLGADMGLTRAFFCSGGSGGGRRLDQARAQYAVAKGEATIPDHLAVAVLSWLHAWRALVDGRSADGWPVCADDADPAQDSAPFVVERPSHESEDEAALRYANLLEDQIITQGPETVLAFIVEPVGGAATGCPDAAGYLLRA